MNGPVSASDSPGVQDGEKAAGVMAVTDLSEVEVLRLMLTRLGAHVHDTDRWSGVRIDKPARILIEADHRKFLDFLPEHDASGPEEGK